MYRYWRIFVLFIYTKSRHKSRAGHATNVAELLGTPFLRFRVTLLRGRRLFHYIFFHHKYVNFHQHMYTKYHQVESKPCSSKRLRLQPKGAVPAPQHSTRLHLSLQRKSILELPRHAIFWNPNDAASEPLLPYSVQFLEKNLFKHPLKHQPIEELNILST